MREDLTQLHVSKKFGLRTLRMKKCSWTLVRQNIILYCSI